MSPGPARISLPVALLLVAAGAGLACAPRTLQARLSNLLRDGVVPGQRLVQEVAQRLVHKRTPPVAENSAIPAESRRIRELELELAEARARLSDRDAQVVTASIASNDGALVSPGDASLLRARGLSARILHGFAGQQWRRLVTLDKGRYGGVTEDALVLEGEGTLIDVGRDLGTTDRDLLTSGRHVVGQITHAGQFSSIVRPITSSEFRGAARLARRSPAGLSFGAVGTLRGTGSEQCELVRILPDEPVEPGDLVVTMSSDSGVERPWIYGVVETATLEDNALEWTIRVRPASRWDDLDHVHVVRLEMNPNRLAARPESKTVEQ